MPSRRTSIDDFPLGALVRTPTGRIGTVVKQRGIQSKFDNYERLVVSFGGGPRDNVVLQPHLLELLELPKVSANDE